MLIAHAPAGYLLTKTFAMWSSKNKWLYFLAGIFGSIAPDIDVIYFWFYTNHSVSHHRYWSHTPYYWMIICACFLIPAILINRKLFFTGFLFFSNVFLHLFLDTIVGGIMWNYPNDNVLMRLITVPAKLNPTKIYEYGELGVPGWVLNLMNHWTFQIELAIVCTAAIIFIISLLSRILIKSRMYLSNAQVVRRSA